MKAFRHFWIAIHFMTSADASPPKVGFWSWMQLGFPTVKEQAHE